MSDIQPALPLAPSYPSRVIFPFWCVTEATAGDERLTDLTKTQQPRHTSRVTGWRYGRAVADLSNLMLEESEKGELEAFQDQVGGMEQTFLFLDPRNCTLEAPDGTGSLIGTGDGTTTTFQLQRTWALTYAPEQVAAWPIRYPDHAYPPLAKVGGDIVRGTNYIRLELDGEENSAWSIDRDTGVIEFDEAPSADVEIRAFGFFYTCVRLNVPSLELTPEGGCWYTISNTALIEPK